MVDLVGIRKGSAIVPANALALDRLESVPRNARVGVRITYRRSIRHHNWYWALISVVAEGLGMHPDGLHANLKYEAGLIERIIPTKLGPVVELQSEGFRSWDETKFREYLNLALPILFEKWLPGVRKADVYKRVEEIAGEPCPF